MKIYINGQVISLEGNSPSLVDALETFLSDGQQKQSFAVALNGDFVGKEQYQQTQLSAEDSIDVLFPIQGG